MVSVDNWQPTGGLMVQADRLGPGDVLHSLREPGWTLAMLLQHDDSTINVVLVLLLLLLLLFKAENFFSALRLSIWPVYIIRHTP